MATRSNPEGFGHFFRRYTKTWMHAVATTGLTAFGLLTFLHRGFVVLAIASYVVPPVVLYLSRARGTGDGTTSPTDAALERPPEPDSDAGTSSGSPARDAAVSDSPRESGSTADADPPPRTGADRPPRDDAERGPTDRGPDARGDARAGETEPRPEPAGGDREDEPTWTVVDVPTDATLFDVAATATGAVAVGGGGVVLEAGDDGWDVLLEGGPGAQGQDLRGVDATDDGAIVWVAGDGGAVGRLEAATGRHTDHSAPADRTDNLTGLAVAGADGDETVLLINGSGAVLRGRYRDGDLAWDEPVKPGGGSSLAAITFVDGVGYCCDTNDGVFETTDGGRTFERVGLEGADGTLTGVAASGRGDCHASTDAGVVHRYDGSRWTPERVCEASLTGIARRGDRLVACDADGAIHDRPGPTADWERIDPGASAGIEGVALGIDRAVAVGGDGTVIERR